MIELELPWPPTVNTYWRHVPFGKKVRVLISKKGREYKDAVLRVVTQNGKPYISGAVEVERYLFCPDWRKRDEDNLTKAIHDSLAEAGVFDGDEFIIRSVSEKWKDPEKIGRVIVRIKPSTREHTIRKSGGWFGLYKEDKGKV